MFRQIRNTFGATELRFQISKIKSPNQKEGFKEVLRELKAELVTNLLVQVPLVAAADIARCFCVIYSHSKYVLIQTVSCTENKRRTIDFPVNEARLLTLF